MPCNCIKGKSPVENARKQQVLELARRYQKEHGGVVVCYRCSDYDFTELENFHPKNKTEIEYIL